MKDIVKFFILTVILMSISALVIIINGRTYTIEYDYAKLIDDVNKINLEVRNENIIKIIDKKLEDGVLKITVESKSEGKTDIDLSEAETGLSTIFPIHVHKSGVVTYSQYLGYSRGCIIIPISIIILLTYGLYLLIKAYKKGVKSNMYQYKNIAYIGMIAFVSVTILSQILSIPNYNGLIGTINSIVSVFSFLIILLPVIFVVSIFVIISNILLIKKEGFNLNNVLGIALGGFLCLTSVLPEIIYNLLYSATWIDIHNEQGWGLYAYTFVEMLICVITTYIECILIGTIIMSLKAARHIPSFDKDFIIILGCQIKADGTLTNLLKGRVDRAIEFGKMQKEKSGKDLIFVPSGGKGDDESIAEAEAIQNYLIEQGINKESILLENKSKNTYENIEFSNRIINEKKKDAKIAFSTTNYHVFRTGNIATEQNIHIEGIGAKTKQYFWINAFIREFIATLFIEKKKHIAVVSSILLLNIIMIIAMYINNII